MCFQISLQNCNDRYTLFIINLFINRTNRSTDSSLHTGIGWWYWTFKIKVRVKVSEIAIPPFFQSFQPFNNRACSTISYHRSIDSTHKQSITRLQTSGQLVGADANAFRVCSSYILSSWAVTLCRACTTGWAHKSPRIAAVSYLSYLLRSLPPAALFYNSYLKSSPALYTPFQVGQVTAVWQRDGKLYRLFRLAAREGKRGKISTFTNRDKRRRGRGTRREGRKEGRCEGWKTWA